MRLLTLNVHAWQEDDQIEKINYLAQTIHEQRYDVIALQEVSQHIDSPIVYDQIREDHYGRLLIEKLHQLGSEDYQLYWDVSHYGYDVYEEGIALLCRHPLLEKQSFYITASTSIDYWKSRKIIGAKFEINNSPIAFYSCHLGWWGDEEEPYQNQVNRLLRQVDSHTPAFFMGDFNASSHVEEEGYEYLLKNGLFDTHLLADRQSGDATVEGKIAGWDENGSGIKIDYIFSNQKVDVTCSNIIFNGVYKEVISDHYGIEIEVDLVTD